MGNNIATERKSTLAIEKELGSITGTASSSGTAVTGTGTAFQTELEVGSVIGNAASGYRTVVAIASNTALTIDSAYDANLSSATINKQAFGTDPTIEAADVIEFVDFTMEADRAEITRNVVNRSFDEIEPVMGEQTVSGNIQIELHGSGTPGTSPESEPLWESAIGERSASTASTTTTGSTTTTVVLTTGGGNGFKVGQHIIIDPTAGGTGVYEVTRITAISTDTLTVSPALSVAPPTGRTVAAGVHYRPTITELHSLWVQFWRGDITLEKFAGNKVSSVSLDFQVGQTVNPSFTLDGKEMAALVAQAYTLGTPSYDAGDVHVARYMAVKMGGVTYPVSKVSLNIANELYRRKDVTTSGTRSIIRTKRTVTGSFDLLYENKDVENAFNSGTTAELLVVSSEGNLNLVPGNTFAISLPKIKYTKASKSKDSGLYAYAVTFKAVRTNGEDSIFISFL